MRHPSREDEDWSEIHGCSFTDHEVRQACDIADLMENYNVTDELLKTFIRDDLKVGYKLFLIMNLSPNELGVMAMREEDDRLVHVIKMRCSDANRKEDGRSMIVFPGEA